MNLYRFKVLIGEERNARDKGIEIRAENIISALKRMEEIVLAKEDRFILTLGIGGRIIEVEKIEEEEVK